MLLAKASQRAWHPRHQRLDPRLGQFTGPVDLRSLPVLGTTSDTPFGSIPTMSWTAN